MGLWDVPCVRTTFTLTMHRFIFGSALCQTGYIYIYTYIIYIYNLYIYTCIYIYYIIYYIYTALHGVVGRAVRAHNLHAHHAPLHLWCGPLPNGDSVSSGLYRGPPWSCPVCTVKHPGLVRFVPGITLVSSGTCRACAQPSRSPCTASSSVRPCA